MSLLYKNEHLSCYNYTTLKNACFYMREIKQGEEVRRTMPEHSVLIYVFSGKVHIACENFKQGEYVEGELLLVPKNFMGVMTACVDTVIMYCVCNKDLKLCSVFSIRKLKEFLPSDFVFDFKTLEAHQRIRTFFANLRGTLLDGLGCIHFHHLKRDELFLYLRASYSKEELAAFFYPIIGGDMDFKDFVLGQYKEVRDVKEFAEKANMSLSTFNRRFKEAFNESASSWLVARKAEEVRVDIVMSTKTFTEIAEIHGFSSPAYLTSFCKKHYGMSPNELRDKGMDYNQDVAFDDPKGDV